MKTTIKKILAIAILCGFALGVFALIAIKSGLIAALFVYAGAGIMGGSIIWAVEQL